MHDHDASGENADDPAPLRTIELEDRSGRLSPRGESWLRQHIERALEELGVVGVLLVTVVDDALMARLHERDKGVAGTTDVLTWDYAEDADRLDAEVVVCIDEGGRQARVRGLDPEQELLLYVVHGVLHCLGYDDHEDSAREAMHAEEDRVLRAIGVGSVYARTPEGAP